ncbi:zinc finger protein 32-like isoform X2 [Zootermopsis nevadensis]|uniref:zinc finger protein 32-like isoform X2 n=1 Tax=Zootermopsis nevadensis TaxID=136037 RepID=UPI000B8ECE2A|nr:zinc finger protein 32-like isoform X2 [Zootermopsis nevadensis]
MVLMWNIVPRYVVFFTSPIIPCFNRTRYAWKEMLLDDGLPNHICKHCVHQLKAAYKFKTKCEHTDTILRRHLQKAQPVNTSSVISQSKTVPVEIQIDTDDDDVDNTAEPLLVLSSTVNLEDQDPLDLGLEEIHSLYGTDSCSSESSNLLSRCSKPALTQNSHCSGMVCVNLHDSNSCVPNSQEQDSVTVTYSNNMDFKKSDITQINCSFEEDTSISEHFLNGSHKILQYKNNSNVVQYRCPICSVSYVNRHRMELHLAKHGGETPYTCPICWKGFGREGGLKAHLKLHTGAKPHVCEVCNKAFSLKGNLKVHQRLHTGEKPFQCTTCRRAFTQKVSLTKHISVHREDL